MNTDGRGNAGKTSRTYTSAVREAEAARTRERIVSAAERLFVRDGYAATPLRAVAVEAGVSVQSVQLAGPKSSLLIAAFERAFAGDEGRHPLADRAEMREILAEPEDAVALTRYAAFIAAANRRTGRLWRAMTAAADADAAVRAAVEDLDGRRRAELRAGGDWLVSRGLVAPERAAEATDVLGFLTQPDSYHYFVDDSGWSPARYETWLRTSIERMVLSSSRGETSIH